MCDVCRRAVCPVGCPNHRALGEGHSVGICSECRREIAVGEEFFRFRRGSLCAECAERVDVDRLIALQGFSGVRALLSELGAERGRAYEAEG